MRLTDIDRMTHWLVGYRPEPQPDAKTLTIARKTFQSFPMKQTTEWKIVKLEREE